jgi:hypothetical protein
MLRHAKTFYIIADHAHGESPKKKETRVALATLAGKIDTFALSHPERALIPISSLAPNPQRSGSFFYNEL